MAYAELVFQDNNPPAGQVLKGIIKVLTGETNLANIEGLTTVTRADPSGYGFYKSEIINPSNEAWTLEYPLALPATGSNVISTATISSPCLTASKKKMVRFILATSTGVFTEPTGGTATNYASTTGWRMYAQGVSAIDASGAIEYGTWRCSDGAWGLINKSTTASTTLEPFVVTISWSARHLLVMCNNRGVTNYTSGVGMPSNAFVAIEIDENHITQYGNSVPCVYGYLDSAGAPGTATTPSVSTVKSLNMLKTYVPSTATITNVVAVGNASTNASTSSLYSFIWCGDTSFGNNSYLDSVSYFVNKKRNWTPTRYVINEAFSNTTMGYLDLTKYSDMWMIPDITGHRDIVVTPSGVKYKVCWLLNYDNSYRTNIMVKYG